MYSTRSLAGAPQTMSQRNDQLVFVGPSRRFQLLRYWCRRNAYFKSKSQQFSSLMDVVSTNIVAHTGCVGASTFWVVALKRDPSTGRAGG